MEKQYQNKVSERFLPLIEEGHEWGYKLMRKLVNPNPTALEVVEQYQYAKENGWLSKNDAANYNNRWLQFRGKFLGQFDRTSAFMKKHFGIKHSHVYANWIRDGHTFGRHCDTMDVIIVQMWNEVAYCVESENQHTSFTMSPGDALYIRHGVYHTPIVIQERATMSFSWN